MLQQAILLLSLGVLTWVASSHQLPRALEELSPISGESFEVGSIINKERLGRKILQEGGGTRDLGTLLVGNSFYGESAAVLSLLNEGADPNFITPDGRGTPLIVAAVTNQSVVIRVLVRAGADPNLQPPGSGRPPLSFAIQAGNAAAVEALIEGGADPNLDYASGITAVHETAAFGNVDILELLLDAGGVPDGDSKNASVVPPVSIGAAGSHLGVIRLLLARGAIVDLETSATKRTALHFAAGTGSGVIIQVLVDNGADVDRQEIDGFTPLHIAAFFGSQQVIEILLELGANKSLTTTDGNTPSSFLCGCIFVFPAPTQCMVIRCGTSPARMIALLE